MLGWFPLSGPQRSEGAIEGQNSVIFKFSLSYLTLLAPPPTRSTLAQQTFPWLPRSEYTSSIGYPKFSFTKLRTKRKPWATMPLLEAANHRRGRRKGRSHKQGSLKLDLLLATWKMDQVANFSSDPGSSRNMKASESLRIRKRTCRDRFLKGTFR